MFTLAYDICNLDEKEKWNGMEIGIVDFIIKCLIFHSFTIWMNHFIVKGWKWLIMNIMDYKKVHTV